MAWDDLKELRLMICDPDGVIALETVADGAEPPSSPAAQTAYLFATTGEYKVYDSALAKWTTKKLRISDSRLQALITSAGSVDEAVPDALELILAQIGGELRIVRIESGTESTEFTDLATLQKFYSGLVDRMRARAARKQGTSSGRMFRTRDPDIGGGM